MLWLGLWYFSGLFGLLLTDYVESMIVNREYDKARRDNWSKERVPLACYGGIRPPAYQIFLFAFFGVIPFVIGLHSIYNYLKDNYGEFTDE
tara:strand:- start:77 stop:349 length:273 start_codon:yes stop_codon:yes gene_type:complete